MIAPTLFSGEHPRESAQSESGDKTLAEQSSDVAEAVLSDWDDMTAQIEDHRFPVCRITIYLTG